MNSPILAYNIRFNLRKKLWFSAIVFLSFLFTMPINSLPTLLGEGGKKIAQFMVDEYAKLAK